VDSDDHLEAPSIYTELSAVEFFAHGSLFTRLIPPFSFHSKYSVFADLIEVSAHCADLRSDRSSAVDVKTSLKERF
jgi:hypothetical protein